LLVLETADLKLAAAVGRRVACCLFKVIRLKVQRQLAATGGCRLKAGREESIIESSRFPAFAPLHMGFGMGHLRTGAVVSTWKIPNSKF
jgi:hypothetical protein